MFGLASIPSYWTGYQRSPKCSSKTGFRALREAEVQQPKTVTTWSSLKSFSAFFAKISGSLAPSSSIILIFLPKMPPASLISLIARSSESRTGFSLIAIVPVRECKIPTLMVSAAFSFSLQPVNCIKLTKSNTPPARTKDFFMLFFSCIFLFYKMS